MTKIKNYLSNPMTRGDYLGIFILMLIGSVIYLAWFMKKLGVNLFGKSTDDEDYDDEDDEISSDRWKWDSKEEEA